ncbi:MAG: TolC family protein [Chlorobium phaeobacteroides]|uniref:Outer membrane efflux protein n=1 Tax=Chlorobium phaeobacteroides (strain BS1) TaxID=331678 RepID=B3EKB0_CHLPB|nr:TolC family protein [Chlorobium phaeobacteroides]
MTDLNHYRLYLVVTIVLALLPTFSLAAGENVVKGQSVTLSLDEAVSIGLERNRDLEVARLDRAIARQKVREAWAGVLPQLDAGFDYTRTLEPSVIYFPDIFGGDPTRFTPLEISQDNAMVASLSLSQPLFNLKALAGIKASSTVRKISMEAYRQTEADVISDIKIAYYNVLISDRQVTILEQSISRWETALRDSRSLFREGVAADIDTLKAYLSVENIKPDLIQARNNAVISRTQLKNSIGIDPESTMVLSDSLVYSKGAYPDDISAAYAEALSARPEVRQLELQIEAEAQNVNAAQAERYPAINAVGQLQAQTQFNDDVALKDTDWPVTSSVGLQVSLPIFTGFRISSQVEQAKLGRLKTMTRLEDLKADIRAEVEVKLSSLQESQQRIEVQSRTIRTAERSYEITLLRFREGIGSQLELADAELQLNKSKTNYLQAIYDYLVARIQYDKALGRSARPGGEQQDGS